MDRSRTSNRGACRRSIGGSRGATRRLRGPLLHVAGTPACALAWLLLQAAAPAAQDKPDLTGRWVIESPPDAAPEVALALTVTRSIARPNVTGGPMPPSFTDLTVDRQLASGIRSDTYQIGVSGGVVGGVDRNGRGTGPNGRSPETRFSVRWDGNRLVIETDRYSGPTRESGPYTEHAEVWRLDEGGRLVITLTDRGSGVAPTTRTLTYRRP